MSAAYDPLVSPYPTATLPMADSYWQTSTSPVASLAPLDQELSCDIAVIGGGYTGLSCAYYLASRYQADVVVVDAHSPAWGCSGRNAGFVLKGSGRLGYAAIIKRWGLEAAQALHREFSDARETVCELIDAGDIDCDLVQPGYLKVAHRPRFLKPLQAQAELLKRHFGERPQLLSAEELKQRIGHEQAHGGLLDPGAMGLNPLKLAKGYLDLVQREQVPVFADSPVIDWQTRAAQHCLRTPHGQLRAKQVVIATAGYTPNQLHPLVNSRLLPVLTSIIVTRPLTVEEMTEANWHSALMMMDTRELKYYYRKLPDNRILFGGRGAIRGVDAEDPIYTDRLLAALKHSFPALRAVTVEHAWNGWIGVSLDEMPRLYRGGPGESIHYSLGYCGAGVAFSAQCGKRLAQQLAGETIPPTPLNQSGLKKFPMAPLRRLGQRAFYHYGRLRDEWL